MIRIAVVDDDWYISSRIERILLSYDHISTYDLDIEVFQNGLDYFKYLKNEHDFDLIFLDIEMSGPNGVEIGRHIRNVMKNNITQIVYITAFDGYEQALFKVRPMDFLKKPFTDIDVINTVETYIELYDSAGKLFEFTCNGVQREHNKKLNNGLPILHKVPPKRDYGRYFCIMAEKGGTSHGGLTEKLSLFFHAKKQEVNAYGR